MIIRGVIISVMLALGLASALSAASFDPFCEPGEALIMSNYPEGITMPGVVFEESFSDIPARVLYYHKNISKTNLSFNILIKNNGAIPMELSIIDAYGGPSRDGIYAGHKLTKDYFSRLMQNKYDTIVVPAGQEIAVGNHLIKPGKVSSGIVKVRPKGPANYDVTMVVVDPAYPHLSRLNGSADRHYRIGKFPESVRKVEKTLDLSMPLHEIPIGDQPYLEDSDNGIVLKGNYGMIYCIKANAVNDTPHYKTVNIFFAPVGGIGRALVSIDGKLIETRFFYSNTKLHPELLHQVSLAPNETRSISIVTMPQPGSFYPANIVFQTDAPRYSVGWVTQDDQ